MVSMQAALHSMQSVMHRFISGVRCSANGVCWLVDIILPRSDRPARSGAHHPHCRNDSRRNRTSGFRRESLPTPPSPATPIARTAVACAQRRRRTGETVRQPFAQADPCGRLACEARHARSSSLRAHRAACSLVLLRICGSRQGDAPYGDNRRLALTLSRTCPVIAMRAAQQGPCRQLTQSDRPPPRVAHAAPCAVRNECPHFSVESVEQGNGYSSSNDELPTKGATLRVCATKATRDTRAVKQIVHGSGPYWELHGGPRSAALRNRRCAFPLYTLRSGGPSHGLHNPTDRMRAASLLPGA